MKVNIYYGGRGLIDDPTLFVINKMQEVLEELHVTVERFNLYELKNNITTLPQTLKTADGIVLATTNKEKPMIYEVVSVGPGTKDVTMTVKAGEKVVVGKFTGTDVTIDKEDYKFVKQDDILAVVTD